MKIGYQFILILFLIFIVGIFSWAVFSPKQDISDRIQVTLKEQEKKADLAFKDVTFEEVSDGVKYWDLNAQKAMVNKSTGLSTLKDSNGTFFQDNQPALLFFSPAALWDMKKKEILMDKPIGYDPSLAKDIDQLLKNSNNPDISTFNLPRLYQEKAKFWFRANNLSWNLANQKLLCIGKIKLNKGEITGYGEKLQGDVAFEKVVLEGNPNVAIENIDSAPITLEAKIIEIRSRENTIYAQGNPQIKWKDALILAQFIKYLQKDKILNLSGRVKITYKDIVAWGNSANYYTDQQKIEISGNAHAQQAENRLNGDKVTVSLKDQKISIAGKSKVVISKEQINQ